MKLPGSLLGLLLGLLACSIGSVSLAQEARSPFEAATVLLGKDQYPFRRMVDLDLDGDIDAIGAWTASSGGDLRLSTYENDGQGVFTSRWSSVTASSGPDHELLLEVGYLNADAYPDLCVMYWGQRFDWINQGNGILQFAAGVNLQATPLALALSDLDGDGRSEVVWVDGTKLHVWSSSGARVEVPLGFGHARSVHVLPGNGPAGLDVFLVHGLSKAGIYYGSPAYGLVPGPLFNSVGPMAKTCDTGDIDGDGDIDAVFFLGSTPATYRVLRRLTPGSWTIEPVVTGGPAEFLVDVDKDGDLDGACCGGGGGGGADTPNNVQPSDFEISLNDGSGAFAPAFQIPGVGSPQFAGAVDVDGDGDVDLVAGRCVVYARGPVRVPESHAAEFPAPRSLRAISDCDGDGDPDVGFSVDSVFTNDGTGRFSADVPPVQPAPAGLAYRGPGFPGDFDGDGDVDLLVEVARDGRAQFVGSLPPTSARGALGMGLLSNQGQGALSLAGPASARGVSFAIDSLAAEASLTVDLDGDGDLDLVTRSMRANTHVSKLWINEGQGRFHAGERFRETRIEWAGDLDLDGVADLMVSRQSSLFFAPDLSEIGMYLGTLGSPGSPPNFVQDPDLCCWVFDPFQGQLTTDDHRLDGYPDFAIVSTLDGSNFEPLALINVFGLGGSILANVALGDAGYDLNADARIALGDVNSDGISDAVFGTHQDELVDISEVHLKKTASDFGTNAYDWAFQILPTGLLVDLNGDGDLDLVGERIVFNRSAP